MPFPTDIGVVDLMLGFPRADSDENYKFLAPLIRSVTEDTKHFPAGYMFKQKTNVVPDGSDPLELTLALMDRYNIEKACIGLYGGSDLTRVALKQFPDRFFCAHQVDPNDITGVVREIRQAYEEWNLKAVAGFPAGCNPQVPIDDRRWYPIYQTCVDLDIPIFMTAGIPGPRVPFACQRVELIDQVMYDFPELKLVMRHGAEPWEALAVKLMLKWPNLYYSTSAFAPKHYPKAIVDYANTRGADKIMYAGYFPMGLTLDRIFNELPQVGFKDEVWPKFLRENAYKVFKL
jgi:predicted TIM-barrel fold metal-dependent hydrolase